MKDETEFKKVMDLLNDCRFSKRMENFLQSDKYDLLRSIKLLDVKPGHRFYQQTDSINKFYIILKGTIGIFYPDTGAIKDCSLFYNRLKCCNEAEAQ